MGSQAVGTTLIGYGLCCAKHVEPASTEQSTITATLDREAVYPQRFPLPPRQQALLSVPGPTVQPPMESTTQKVTTRGVHSDDDATDSFFDIETHKAALLPATSALVVYPSTHCSVLAVQQQYSKFLKTYKTKSIINWLNWIV